MRQTIATIIFMLCGVSAAWSQQVSAIDVSIERNGNYMAVDMSLDMTGLKVRKNRAMLLTPCLINGEDSVDMTSIGIYGRKRYFHYKRSNGKNMISGPDEITYRAKKVPDTLAYHQILPYQGWMDDSRLKIHGELYGCCNSILSERDTVVGEYSIFTPKLVYVRPQAEISKMRAIEATAYISFPVNKTEIKPEYLNNRVELAKIQATIDSVKNGSDYTITTISLKGYASPEGSYEYNSSLAKGRTEALSEYVREQYDFGDDVIVTDYEAEDWSGLRVYVEGSSLEHRTEILAMIDDDSRDADAKEWLIKSTYPSEYRGLLDNCYPRLRHTDYKVSYNVRTYSDINEIHQVYKTHPQDLSLNEIYLLAQECEPNTDEFSDVFETAVRLYPEDETANLNAANAAISRGDLTTASRYLEKAGNSGEAEYARGVFSYMSNDYPTAKIHLRKAADRGIAEAKEVMKRI
ncbi:MAG: DUF3868 domain-containing protein [Prevotella sp.]|nr:DUF3868 domain-containing protein [Prevotella sp.]